MILFDIPRLTASQTDLSRWVSKTVARTTVGVVDAIHDPCVLSPKPTSFIRRRTRFWAFWDPFWTLFPSGHRSLGTGTACIVRTLKHPMNPLHATLLRSPWPSFYFILPTSLPAVVVVTMCSLSSGCACRLVLAQYVHLFLYSVCADTSLESARASHYHLAFLSRRDGKRNEPLPVLPSSRTEGGSCIQDCFIRRVCRPLSYTCIIVDPCQTTLLVSRNMSSKNPGLGICR